MAKKLFTQCRIILLIGVVCAVTISASWKAIAGELRVFDYFFESSPSDVLHIEAASKESSSVYLTNTIATQVALSEDYPTIISNFAFVSDRFSVKLQPGSFLSLDVYQYHPKYPSDLQPLAKGAKALVFEDRPLNNGLNGQIILVDFSNFGNQAITEGSRTIKPGYRLAVKFNPALNPGFYCLVSQTWGPICQIKGTVK